MRDAGWDIDYSLKGTRIELIYTDDAYTKLKPGDKGTIKFEHQGSVAVTWDCGSRLSMRESDGDRFRILEDENV